MLWGLGVKDHSVLLRFKETQLNIAHTPDPQTFEILCFKPLCLQQFVKQQQKANTSAKPQLNR